MVETRIIRRPIISAVPASGTMLSDILNRIATIRGRAAAWGVSNDSTRAELLTGQSIEADFTNGYYRDGFVEAGAPEFLPGWTFSRTGTGTARNAGGRVETFATGVPRITSQGLLIERGATNLVAYGNDLTAHSVSGASVTADGQIGPDGLQNMDTLVEDTSTGAHRFSFTASYASNDRLTVSFYARARGRSRIAVDVTDNVTGSMLADVDLTTGAVNASSVTGSWSGLSVVVTKMDAGIWRVSLTGVKGAGTSAIALISMHNGTSASYAGDGASGIDLGGLQINAGGPVAFIPTTTSTATRGADQAVLEIDAPIEGGVFVEVNLPTWTPGTATAIFWDNGGYTNLVQLALASAGFGGFRLENTVETYDETRPGYAGGQRVRAFIGWRDKALVCTVDGVELDEGILGLAPAMTRLRLGAPIYDGDYLGSVVRRLIVFRVLPTADERLALTS